jgi:hypothetical protein
MQLEQKIQNKINDLTNEVERDGYTKFSVCDHYNWDRDLYNFRMQISNALSKRGYNVTSSVKWGVIDYQVTKILSIH